VFVHLGVGFEALSWLEPEGVPALFQGVALAVTAVTLLTGAWLVGIVGDVTAHAQFTVVRRGDRLVATEGLFTRRRVELRPRKIQLVAVEQPLLRRLLGFGSLRIETAAATTIGGTRQAEAMIPVVETTDVPRVLAEIAPGAASGTWDTPLRPPHPRALDRALVLAGLRGLALAAVISVVAWPWGLVSLLVLPTMLVGAVIDYRNQGFLVTDTVIVSRTGFWNRRTAILYRNKLQALDVLQGPLAWPWGLGQLHLHVAGSTVSLPMLAWEEVGDLLLALSPRVQADAMTAEPVAPA
jgi:putative membrane protein